MADDGRIFRVVRAVLLILTFSLGMAVSLSLGWAEFYFSDCPLFCEMTVHIGSNNTAYIDHVKWGPISVCWYVTFTAVVCVIVALVWFWFSVLVGMWMNNEEGEKERYSGDSFAVPSLVLTFALFVCVLVAASKTTSGLHAWCRDLKTTDGRSLSCDKFGRLRWTEERGGRGYHYVKTAQVCTWLLALTLGVLLVLLGVRLRRNAQIWQLIQVMKTGNNTQIHGSTVSGFNNPIYEGETRSPSR